MTAYGRRREELGHVARGLPLDGGGNLDIRERTQGVVDVALDLLVAMVHGARVSWLRGGLWDFLAP